MKYRVGDMFLVRVKGEFLIREVVAVETIRINSTDEAGGGNGNESI